MTHSLISWLRKPGVKTRFSLSGVAGIAANYLVAWLLTEFASLWYIVSIVLGNLANNAILYFTYKYWVYPNPITGKLHWRELIEFIVLRIQIILGGASGVYVLVEYAGLHYLWAYTVTLSCLLYYSFHRSRTIFGKSR